ncbi:MAG: DUF2478 domain-containing protein [Alphaproteobacteria bacterium]|nr:DUF2478 domain-containing protein [Alphaproteobacteria bacterium]MCB9931257.1 DUF2478 domain-containing protein [Alphaproteobacteria bacterium]
MEILAYVIGRERGHIDPLLIAVADRLLARGVRVCGTVQTNTDNPNGGHCDMDVRVLPDGPEIRISEERGALARGCRLDAGALEGAVGLVEAELDAGADCLIVNKFGKHEAEGHGFRDLIAKALALGVPVLVSVNKRNEEAFLAFADGLATPLSPDATAMEAWLSRQMAAAAA